jgi:hypothetical protein
MGQVRVAAELSLKLGISVSPRTVRNYWPENLQLSPGGQRWATFVRNHAKAMVACDFVVAVTVRFRILYVFVGDGDWEPQAPARECHASSHLVVDTPATSGGHSQRS